MTLEIRGLSAGYGAMRILHDIDVQVEAGRITTVIGPNGAGKTTLMKTVAGLLRPSSGSVRYNGDLISGLRPGAIVSRGIALVPEGRRLFLSMTVRENLTAGAYSRSDRTAIARDLEEVVHRFPVLRERINQRASKLSGGQQQMLAVGRALMSRPRTLLLDEPSIGLAPVVVQQIGEIVRDLSRDDVHVLLVEQNANLALKLAEMAYVLENGRITRHGPAAGLRQDAAVRSAYLGI